MMYTGFKRTVIFLGVTFIFLTAATCYGTAPDRSEEIEISFDYKHMSTMASNQIAIWVENEEDNLIKTIIAIDFTAVRRGYLSRDMALPEWAKAAKPEDMTDEELDAVSSATPREGNLVFIWDFTNEEGEHVPDGKYRIKVEGTLFWESDVVYTAEIDTKNLPEDTLVLQADRSDSNIHDNEDMISNIVVLKKQERNNIQAIIKIHI